MVTKREIADAQAALNEAVRELRNELAKLRAHGMSDTWPLAMGVPREILQPIYARYNEWDEMRRSLEGQGPAAARSTSIAAAKANVMLKQSVRRDVLTTVVLHYNHTGEGMTSEQIQARLHGSHQSVSARVSELVNVYELLRDSGRKIKTTSGYKAIVWEPTEEARLLVEPVTTGRDDG